MRERSLAEQFREFGDVECRDEPVYRALCALVAKDASLLALMDRASPTQRRPNLLLAAVHDQLLAGVGGGLAEYFPTVGGAREPDEALPGIFAAFCEAHREALLASIAGGSTQTNEVGRCAVLWPTLEIVARRTGRRTITLVDVGCSAGLNLGVDQYRYEYASSALGPADSSVRVRSSLRGSLAPPSLVDVQIARKIGLDLAPIDVRDPARVRWLKACLWPHAAERHARFDAAVALARTQPRDLRLELDCAGAIASIAREASSSTLVVFFNSWVLSYFTEHERARYVGVIEGLVSDGCAWVSAESTGLVGAAAGESSLSGAEAREATEWLVLTRDHGYERAAMAHPHGAWIEWLAAVARRSLVADTVVRDDRDAGGCRREL